MLCAPCAIPRCAPRRSASCAGACNGWASCIAGAFAALAGALYAFLKGSVFPDNISISLSIDGLVMVLLGGVGTVSGGVVGAAIYRSLSIWVISHTDYSKLVLGALIILLVVLFPKGLVGQLQAWRSARAPSSPWRSHEHSRRGEARQVLFAASRRCAMSASRSKRARSLRSSGRTARARAPASP